MGETDEQLSTRPAPAQEGRIRGVHYLRAVRLEEGGVVRAVLDLCAALAVRGNDITLLTSDAKDVPTAWGQNAVGTPRIVTIPVPQLLGRLSGEVQAVLRGADVLHLHTPWELANLPLARAAMQHSVPYVLTIHGMLDEWSLAQKFAKKHLFLALAGRRFLARAARVHCTAQAELTQSTPFLRPGSGIVIPLLVDLDPFLDLPGPAPALKAIPQLAGPEPRVLFLSRLHPKKRPELLIEAASRLQAAGVAIKTIIAGPGENPYVTQLKELAHRLGISDRVFFPGMVRGQTKVSLYQSADVFVLPTSQENFGFVLVEALAAGTPVVTTRGVDIWDELRSAGAVIAEPTADALAAAIRPLLSDPSHSRQLGQQGRRWVLRELSPQSVVGRYEQMYRSLRAPSPAVLI